MVLRRLHELRICDRALIVRLFIGRCEMVQLDLPFLYEVLLSLFRHHLRTLPLIRRCGITAFCPPRSRMSVPLSALIIIGLLPPLYSATPSLTVTTTAVSPRLSLLAVDEGIHWRAWAAYRQEIGSRLMIQSHFEYGSVNDHFRNSFRLHDLSLRAALGNHSLRVGRITHWSSLVQGRVDGGELSLRSDKLGTFRFMGGLEAVPDFSDTAFTEKQLFLATWGGGSFSKNVAVKYWMRKDGDETHSYVGSNLHTTVLKNVRISGTFAWNLEESQIYHARIYARRYIGSQRVTIGLRHRRYIVSAPYAWVTKPVTVSPAISVGLVSPFARDISLWNQFVHRFGSNSSEYLRSTLSFKGHQGTFLAGVKGKKILTGSGLGTKRQLNDAWSLGFNMMINGVDFGDLVELEVASSIYAWLKWEPKPNIMMRLYGQYKSNPYYRTDGRGGVVIHVAL